MSLLLLLSLALFINLSDVSAATLNQSTNKTLNTSKVTVNQTGATPITPKVTFTTSQINTASSNVKTFTETNKRLPNYVTISTYKVTMPQFLQLLTDEALQVNNGSTALITLKNVNKSLTNPVENVKTGTLNKTEYLTLDKQIKKTIDTTGKSPAYINTSLGKMRFESLVYTYSKVMNFYSANNRLPNTVSVAAFYPTSTNTITEGTTTTIITKPPANGYSPYNIVVTAQKVTATAKCSCGYGTYTYKTVSFLNYCPICGHYGTISYSKPCAEGQWTCSYCDSDYCMQCGKEKWNPARGWLKPA